MQLTELRHLALIAEKKARLEGNIVTADALLEFAIECDDEDQVGESRNALPDQFPSRMLPVRVKLAKESQLSRC